MGAFFEHIHIDKVYIKWYSVYIKEGLRLTNKQKIVSYVDDDIKKSIQDFAKKYGMAESMLVKLILQNWIRDGGKIEIK